MFITHCLNFITSICSGLVVQVVSALLRGNWQDFNWHDASRSHSAIAALLVIHVRVTSGRAKSTSRRQVRRWDEYNTEAQCCCGQLSCDSRLSSFFSILIDLISPMKGWPCNPAQPCTWLPDHLLLSWRLRDNKHLVRLYDRPDQLNKWITTSKCQESSRFSNVHWRKFSITAWSADLENNKLIIPPAYMQITPALSQYLPQKFSFKINVKRKTRQQKMAVKSAYVISFKVSTVLYTF